MAHRPANQYDAVERRIRAAMWIAGVNDFKELGSLISARNLGETTLRRLNSSSATKLHLQAIASACHLPYEFFTVDFGRLPELEQPTETATPAPASASDLTALQEQVALIAAQVTALAAAALPPSEEAPAATGDPQQRQRP